MADFNALEALINAYIKQNGVKAITGQVLNGVLRGMVSALGKGWTVAGEAEPNTDPGTMTGPVAYVAHTAGTYTNFGGLVVNDGEVAFLKYNEQIWTKEVLASLAATATVDDNVGTPSVVTQFVNGVLTFAFHNIKGDPGINGTDGQDGAAAGFGTVAATVDNTVGTPAVSVTESGPNTAKNFSFAFTGLKGETGVTSVVVTVDNTSGTPQCTASLNAGVLTLAFTGLKGAQGNPGSSVDYPFTLVNNLTTNDPDQALTAAMGFQLESEITQLEQEINGESSEETLTRYARQQGKTLKDDGTLGTTSSQTTIVDTYKNIKPNTNYKISGRVGSTSGTCLVCFYDADDSFILGSASCVSTGTATPYLDEPITSPPGAYICRVMGNTNPNNQTPYPPKVIEIVAGESLSDRIESLEAEVEDIKSVIPAFDLRGMPHDIVYGFYIAGTTQKWTAVAGGVSFIFKVYKGDVLHIVAHSTNASNYAYLSSYNGITDGGTPSFVTGYGSTVTIPSASEMDVTVPVDCFMCVNCATGSASGNLRYPQHIYKEGDNPFFGLKSIWQGPSTMYGLGASPLSARFSERVSRYLCMTHENYGQTGSTIAKKVDSYESAFDSLSDFQDAEAGGLLDTTKRYLVKDNVSDIYPWTIYYYDGADWVSVQRTANNVARSPIVDRLSEMDTTADVVVFLGGTNDFMYDWTQIGEDTDRVNTTIKGAMHLICKHLVDTYPNKFIIWINSASAYRYQDGYTSPYSKNSLGYSGWEEGDAVKEVLRQYSIPLIDMAGEGGLTPENSAWWDDYDSPGTKVHPNSFGHLRLTKYLVSKMLEIKNLVR